MHEPTIITWILIIFGAITFFPLLWAQLVMLLKPRSQKARDIMIGKGEAWRDKTHFKSAAAFAWADWLVILPLFVSGNIGVLAGQLWGYVIWIALGVISIYISIVFWIMEKEYTYPSCGPLVYFTYYWGFFLYWGIAAIVYSAVRLLNVVFS
jgi:hypothetical protein